MSDAPRQPLRLLFYEDVAGWDGLRASNWKFSWFKVATYVFVAATAAALFTAIAVASSDEREYRRALEAECKAESGSLYPFGEEYVCIDGEDRVVWLESQKQGESPIREDIR